MALPRAGKTLLSGRTIAVSALIAAVGAYLRLRGLSARGLWTDELVSWWAVSSGSLGTLLRRSSSCMATPPLAFVAERVSWLALGKSEWALRLPSVLAGIGTIVVVFVAGVRMFGVEAGAIAAAFIAIHPVHIGFSVEARPYAIAGLFAVLSIWSWSELTQRDGRRWSLVYVLATAGLLYTQFVFLPLLLAQTIALLLGARAGLLEHAAARRAALALGGALALALPLAPQIAGLAGRASSLAWASAEEYPPWISTFFQTTPLLAAALIALVVALVLRLTPAVAEAAHEFDPLHLALAFLVPCLLLGVVAVALQLPSLAKARYGSAYLGICALLLGWALTRIGSALPRRVCAVSFLSIVFVTQVLPPLASGRGFNLDAEQEDWRGATRFVESHRQTGDLVLLRAVLVESAELFDGTLREGCATYLSSPVSDFYLSPGSEVAILPQDIPPRFYATTYGSLVSAQARKQARIWIVLAGASDPYGYVESVLGWLQEATHRPYRMEDPHAFGPLSVALLVPAR